MNPHPRVMHAGRDRCWLSARRCRCPICLALPARAEGPPWRTQILVREQRSRVRRQGRRCGRALHGRPENAIFICVDEKLSIPALERAQGFLKLPHGLALIGHSHEYKRNGTSTRFATFEVATGKVMATHKKRRRRVEFLDFMNDIALMPTRPSTSSSTTSTPTNPRMTAGSSIIRTCTSTSRRRALPGSTRSKSGSRS
jgi:hypothetical protein